MANDLKFQHIYQKAKLGQFGVRVLGNGDTSPSGENYHTIGVLHLADFTADCLTSQGDSSIDLDNVASTKEIHGHFTNVSCTQGEIICYII